MLQNIGHQKGKIILNAIYIKILGPKWATDIGRDRGGCVDWSGGGQDGWGGESQAPF